ncbi:preprotein translocase subunit SecE [Thermodesulfobacteriota bacterium]
MGRLQRKKASGKKKKKQRTDVTTTSQQKSSVVTSKSASLSVPSSDTEKKKASSQSKAIARTRTEPGKLKSYLDRGLQFLREVKVELKKVTWPTRKQTIGSTVVVIILVMIISSFLGLVDMGLASLVRVVLQ